MAPRARKIAATIAAGILMATFVVADEPPRDLHLEGDHWTAWNPPSEHAEGAQIYAVQPGDTLWDLAAQYFGDPYLWPQLWERNQYILDAHWIYPGDPLVISVEVVPVETLAQQPLPVEEPMMEDDTMLFGSDLGPPEPLGSETDMFCSGFIGPESRDFPFTVVGSEAAALAPSIYGPNQRETLRGKYGVINTLKSGLSTSDIIYLDGGRSAGMTAGSLYMIVAPLDLVRHPITNDKLGRFYRYEGRVRVLSTQADTAIAEIISSCVPSEIGAVLMPYVAEPVPLARRTSSRPVNLPADESVLESAPAIVHVDRNLMALGEGSVVFIDRGAAHDVTPGDIYTIYRLNVPGLPGVVLGELAVLAVHDNTSMAKILSSRYTVRLGDRIDPK